MSKCERVYCSLNMGKAPFYSSIHNQMIVRNKSINFNDDLEISVIVAFVCCDFKYLKFDGSVEVKSERHVLLLRRGFEVGSMRGLWTGIAGVQDISPKTKVRGVEIGQENALRFKVAEEFTEETGWILSSRDSLNRVATLRQTRPENPKQTFVKEVFKIDVRLRDDETTPAIVLDWEHTGCVWVPISELVRHLQGESVSSPALKQVLQDGVTPDFLENLGAVLRRD